MASTDLSLAGAVDQALRAAGVPLVGVSIGDPADRATWTVQLAPTATESDRTTAAATIAAFDVVGLPARQFDAQAISDVDLKALRAVSQALWEAIPAPTLTKVQLRARAIAIWKTL